MRKVFCRECIYLEKKSYSDTCHRFPKMYTIGNLNTHWCGEGISNDFEGTMKQIIKEEDRKNDI